MDAAIVLVRTSIFTAMRPFTLQVHIIREETFILKKPQHGNSNRSKYVRTVKAGDLAIAIRPSRHQQTTAKIDLYKNLLCATPSGCQVLASITALVE